MHGFRLLRFPLFSFFFVSFGLFIKIKTNFLYFFFLSLQYFIPFFFFLNEYLIKLGFVYCFFVF